MVRPLKLERSTSEVYAKRASEALAQSKALSEKLTKDCNALLKEIKEMFSKTNFDEVINTQNNDNAKLENLRDTLFCMRTYLNKGKRSYEIKY